MIGYSKDQQTNHNRLKPKKESTFGKNKSPLKGSKKRLTKKSTITKIEKEYLEWLQNQDYPCFVCGKRNNIEWHHVKENSTDKKNHTRLIPLCGESCHRNGQILSAHGTPVKWRETYSMEEQNHHAKKIYMDFIKFKI